MYIKQLHVNTTHKVEHVNEIIRQGGALINEKLIDQSHHVMLSSESEQLPLSESSSSCCLSLVVERSESIRACLLQTLCSLLTEERFRDFCERRERERERENSLSDLSSKFKH